jgi:hypothetical protein
MLLDNVEIGSLTGLMIVGGLKGAESFLCCKSWEVKVVRFGVGTASLEICQATYTPKRE